MLAVSLVALLVILSGRFARYMAEAVAGKIDAGVLFTLISYRLPHYLELVLPLGLFIGIMLAYGRLYIDSEMTVLQACGFREKTLLGYTLLASSVVAAVVAFFSLYLSPLGARAADALIYQQRSRTEFETLKPGRFQKLTSNGGVAFVQAINPADKTLHQVFLAGTEGSAQTLSLMTAQTGTTLWDEKTQQRYLVLQNGRQYRGQPGQANYEVVEFNTYQQFIPAPSVDPTPKKPSDSLHTLELFQLNTLEAKAALHWRFSLPVLVLVVAFMAVPLSRTHPRAGRFAKLIPAILLYIFYLVLANSARGAMESGKNAVPFLIWWVHAGYAFLGLVLFNPHLFKWPFKKTVVA